MSSDLWVISCYFNPCRYRTKRQNFDIFKKGMERSGVNLLVVELAFGDEEYELPESDQVLRLRGNGVMWQKERLLNIAAATLPKDCTKVAWFDNDLIFDDPRWVERTSKALDKHVLIQPFTSCVRMERGQRQYSPDGEIFEGYTHSFERAPHLARHGKFGVHGHTGFAWAARRELFEECGLYEPCLTGSGDHLMAHGFAGGFAQSQCLPHIIGDQPAYRQHFARWARRARDVVDGKIGSIPGTLLHLWHGDTVDRRYNEMNKQFMTFDFNPDQHLTYDESGLLEWSDEAPKRLRDWAETFFWIRREDGESIEPKAKAVA